MSQQKLSDTRTRAHGWPLAMIVGLCVGATVLTWRAVVAATVAFVAGEYVIVASSIIAALMWILGCVGIAHNGKRMRRMALAAWIVNLLGAIFGVILPQIFDRVNPWFEAGSTYFYLPTIGAVLALGWLLWSRPAAVAARQLGGAQGA